MKVTGTKKLLIILFALTCVVTLGLGALFGGWFFKSASSAYAEEEKVVLPDFADERLQKISEKTGIGVKELTFYIKAGGGTENDLCNFYDNVGKEEFVTAVTRFLSDYSRGELRSDIDFSDEDWFIAPDQVGSYVALPGNQDTVTNYTSSKNALTKESQYFRNVGFAMGPYDKWIGAQDNTVNDRNSRAWYETMKYNFAWVEEGEEFYFGVNCNKSVTKGRGAIDNYTWMNTDPTITTSWASWCSTPAAIAAGYTYNANYVTETYINGWWFDEFTGECYEDPDPTRNNRTQWLDEFSSSINPSTAFMSGSALQRMNGTTAAATGQMGIWLSSDAPSGTYYFTLSNPSGGYWYGWNNSSYASGTTGSKNNYQPNASGLWQNWWPTLTIAVSICRTGITTPRLKFNNGVDSLLKNKEVDYNNDYHELIIENDWGPGLITYNISKWDDATSAWVDYADNTDIPGTLDCTLRSYAGQGRKGDTVFRAKDAGKYKIKMTPFRNWEKESDTDPVEFTFTINPKKLEVPTIFGDDANTGYKFINATGRTLFVTIYPVSSEWSSYSAPTITNSLGTFSLSQETWDDNGVLTLGGTGQGVYTITVTIDDPLNVAWDTTVPPGDPPDTSPKVFTFEIGPMKIVVPDIIKGDSGESVTQFKKEVVYDGSVKSLSFMPINPLQLIIEAIDVNTGDDLTDISTSDQTLTVNAKDAGHYKVTITVKPEYIFDNTQSQLVYELIIHEAEIEAPYLCAADAAVAVNNVKTVTYGGEKIAGTSQDWVATLTFENADEARINWVSKGSNISESGWSDSTLTLSAKPAATYVVTFEPKKNYKWKDGVVVPDYTLIIEKLKIAKPLLYNDAEVTPEGVCAEYTDTTKSIGFDNSLHPIIIEFPTLAETSSVEYLKSASVYSLHEGNFETSWDGDKLTKTGSEAGTFKITITPTNNYCWSDGSSDSVIFTFIIVPINVDCLDMYTTDEFGGGLMEITNTEYHVYLNYDGEPKTVRIGNPDALYDKEKYLTTGKYAMTFNLLDKDGNFITPDSSMTVDESGGFLTVTMVNAGEYRIGVSLNDTNYWWTESKGSMMIYTLTINAEGINRPNINEGKSVGNNTEGNFGVDIMRGTFAEVTDDHKFFMLVADFDDEKYSEFVKITDKDGNVYDYATFAAMRDSDIVDLRNTALAENHGVFTTWVNKNVSLYAVDQGEYVWTFELTSDNYKWSGTDDRKITLTIVIKRSPVSGIEMRYVGDEIEASLNGDDGFRVGDENIRGDEYNSDKTIYAVPVFSEDWKAVRFVQSIGGDIYKAGFSTQFEYEVYKKAANGSYTEEIVEPREDAYTVDELRLGFYDAGEYEIWIRPKDNYCWNNDTTSTSRSYVVFKLKINTLVIEKPVVKDPTGDGVKETLYNHEFQLFQLELKDYPKGYMVRQPEDEGFFYINDDLADRIAAGDTPIVHTTGVADADGVTMLGSDADTSLLSVEARSAGEYHLRVVVSNINNYKFSTGDSSYYYQYRFIIKKISVAIPNAYLTKETLSADSTAPDYVDAIMYNATDVATNASASDAKPIDYSTQYSESGEYCGRYYAIYLYGTDVALGSFSISAAPDLATGDASHELQPDDPSDPLDSSSAKLGYYRLAVREVSMYTITLNFVTADYYWGTDFASGSASRTYEFTVFKKVLSIPKIQGINQPPLISDTLTVEREFKNQAETIVIEDVYFGELISTTPDVYSFINLVATNVTVSFTLGADGKADVTVTTANPALVTDTYKLELKINNDNAQWERANVDLSKFYVIKINKAKLTSPTLEGSQTGDTRKVTYNADVWDGPVVTEVDGRISDYYALRINNMDPDTTNPLITYTLSDTDLMIAGFSDGSVLDRLIVSTVASRSGGTASGANVGTYTVVVSLSDSDNYEWSDASIADITFTFVIEPMKVAKPYIDLNGKSEAQMGVVDRTRTVTYAFDGTTETQYDLDIGNYWHNVDDTNATRVPTKLYDVGVIPSVMSYALIAGTPDAHPNTSTRIDTYFDYFGKFTVDGNSSKYSDMLYNEFNNGILQLKATKAGKYVVEFTLTDNAVWADGSTDPIDVTLVIKKLEHEDPFIKTGSVGATIDDRTVTYTYELDTSGNPVERTIVIDNFFHSDTSKGGTYAYDYMSYDHTLTTGTVSTVAGDGYLGDGVGSLVDYLVRGGIVGDTYEFKVEKAGTYVVTFTIDDPDNHRWKFADVASVSFVIQINKLAIANPVIESSYLLTTENVDGTDLVVDFDKHEHTILVKSLFENVYDPSLAYNVANASGLGSKYFTVSNTTDDRNSDSTYSSSHANRVDNYDTTSGMTVGNLFDKITPLPTDYYAYNGDKATFPVNLVNLFTLTAYTPGNYYLTFKLTDPDNMEWADGSTVTVDTTNGDTYIDYKLIINKVMHDAPIVAPGTSTSVEYDGGDVYFTIKNVFNGIKEANSTNVVATVSEQFKVISYTGPDSSITTPTGYNPASFVYSWYDGNLVLKMHSIGEYIVEVSITDPDYIKWNGVPATTTSMPFTFNVTKRTLDVDVTLRSNDSDVGAKLAAGETSWPKGIQVYADILIKGFRMVPGTGVDDNATFDIYYAKTSDPTTRLGTLTGVTSGSWIQTANNDGTYNGFLTFSNIQTGSAIDKGNYTLNIVQTDTNGNYLLTAFSFPFTIEADPAPFKDNMIEWTFSISNDTPGITYSVGPFGNDEDNPLHLPYKLESDGVTPVAYTINFGVTAACLAGHSTAPGPFSGPTAVTDALHSWKVDWDGTYGGTRTANSVTSAAYYMVTVTLTANDPNNWAFDTTTYKFYYVIDPALYDISGLKWNYDATSPFEFDGSAKTVRITGTLPTNLTIDHYETECTEFVSGNVSFTEALATGNSKTYAGKYLTTVYFTVPTPSNYKKPENPTINADKTYDDDGGTFIWTLAWEIKPLKIEVDWTQGGTNTSDGDLITRSPSTVDGPHASKFTYDTYKEDPVGSGTWTMVPTITRVPGQTVTYKVEAKLISDPLNPAGDYSRSYIAEFIGNDNPCLMEIGGDDTIIANHTTINGERNLNYEYTGDPVEAAVVIDFDTSNGLISESDIAILFVNLATPAIQTPVAPHEIGNYKAVLKLSFTGTDEIYALSETEYYFNIVKAKFHPEDLEWRVTHATTDATVEARFDDTIGNKWVNVDTNEEVEIVYDGFPYVISLVSKNTNLTFTMSDHTQIDANPREADMITVINYVTSAQAVFDTAHYEFATSEFAGTLFDYTVPATSTDPIIIKFEWEIARKFLDLSRVNWGYEKPFEFTLKNGVPQAFKVELINLPEYLVDKIDYTVERVGELITGDVTNEGSYKTTADIRTSDISDNYELGTWPAAVNNYVEWLINPKRLTVPEDDKSWSEFDGTQHNLLKPFGLDVDWTEYFDIVVTYEDFEGNRVDPYDGTLTYGGKYYAYNAGIYSFSFVIKKDFNVTIGSKQMMNIVWAVAGALGYDTDNDQATSFTVNKKNLKITGWFENYENSYILTAGNIDATKFVEYIFYTGSAGNTGTEVSLDRVLNSAGNETFSMVPVVRKAYQGNITLEPETEFTYFTTKEISEDDAIKVNGKPYIYGYAVDGKFTQYTNDELAEGVFVTYMGKNVTFRIYNWDYYKNYVEVWGGDDLTQIEANEYSLTLVLRKDVDKPLYWGKNDDGTIDRSSVKLTFEIRYNMLTIPEIPTEVTYTGKEIDVLSLASNATLKQLTAQYGDYVEIVGNKATNVGEQTLYLKIKEEYALAVRWNNGSDQGLLGTYSIAWKILPVLLQRPEVDPDARIVYDGEAHSVYEIMKGYDKKNPSTAIANLMANVNEDNARSVNAGGPFKAVLSLPNDNFAWCDAAGKKLDDRSAWTTDWYIERQTIDFNDAYWGYMDGDTPVEYDPEKPFVYTLVNGAAKEFKVEILGLPEILKLYTSYTTNGNPGNSASAVNSGYTTRVEIDLDRIDTKNYAIVTGSYASISELVWSIIPREFDLPEYDDGWTVFDAKVHDLAELLGLEEDWAEYFDVKVEYKENEGDTYADYHGDNYIVVGYSLYKGFYYGYYRLTVTLKNNGSLMEPGVNLKWKSRATGSNPEPFEIIVSRRTITVIGWNESDEYSEVFLEDYETLAPELADRLEYIIYEDGNPDVLLDRADVASSSGNVFFIDYKFKQGTDPYGIAYSYGIDLVFEQGVPHPYEFGTRDYGTQPIIWVPMPILEKAILEYNGELQTFKIKGFDSGVYKLSGAERISLNYNHGLSLDASVTSYVYLQVANSLSVTAAGEYTAVVRLLSQVRLSWYDPTLYTTSADYRTLYESDGVTPVSAADIAKIYNNKSITLNFKVKKKVLPMLTDEDLEILKGIVVTYDGTEKDVTQERADLFKILEDKYGKIFAYTGNTGTAADDYVLGITLKDPDSCIWYDGEPEKIEVSDSEYVLIYVREGSGWKIIYAKKNDSGPMKDASGNYIEYNDGDYFLDVKYLPEFEMELIDASAYSPNIIDLTTGQLNIKYKYLYDAYDDLVTINGQNVEYVYVMNGTDIQRFDADGNVDPAGTYVKRIKLDLTLGEKEYGYKVPVMEFVTEYTPLFTRLDIDPFTFDPTPVIDKDGNPVSIYLYFNGTNYELREYLLDANGKFIPDGGTHYLYNTTLVETVCEMLDIGKSYNIISGAYVEHPTNDGVFMLRYVLNSSGSRKQQVVYDKDADGNLVIDVEHTVITINKYNVIVDKKYEVDWKIDSSILAMPYFDVAYMPQYTGKTIYADEHILHGFLPDLMKIVEGGEGVKAGEYTAKIVLTTENSKWNPEDTTENYVLVTWRIDTAKVDLSKISWYYTDGTDMYENSDSFVYSRKDGKPVVFWVGIANLPEVMQDRVVFTTNQKDNAYAGINVGKYNTSVKFVTDENFDPIVIPDTFETSVTWSIKRRMLSIPDSTAVQLIFDSEAHDLLKMIGAPTDWYEYYDIQVMYSNGGDYVPYEGHEGNPYIAYGFGSYKFTFTIKSGINTSITNPNVVWIKRSGEVEVPTLLSPEESEGLSAKPAEEPPVKRAVKKPVQVAVEEEVIDAVEEASVIETSAVEKAAVVETVVSETELAIREVCDRLKQLTYGAEINLQSFRKYSMRGTL